MKIALIGTDGLPARYGGFETFVEQLAPRLVTEGHIVRIIGSSKGRISGIKPQIHGVEIININLSANGVSSVLFDLLSFIRVMFWADGIILLGISAGIFLPVMRRFTKKSRLVINIDGKESQRSKWNSLQKSFASWSELVAVRSAPAVVADNEGIAKILSDRYQRQASVIAYGGDHVQRLDTDTADEILRTHFSLTPSSYALTVARAEPENHIIEMIEGFLKSKIPTYALVSNFDATPYGRAIKDRYQNERRILMIESNYKASDLASLRSRCLVYIHGHSAGGTNPSLVEMLPYARPILAWDCEFNRFTLHDECGYFNSVSNLTKLLMSEQFRKFIPSTGLITDPAYNWNCITSSYIKLIKSLPVRSQ